MYIVKYTWEDFGQLDDDGIPGVFVHDKDKFNFLEEAINDYFMHISFDENPEIYDGKKSIEKEILYNEELFKKFYEDKEALKYSDFSQMTYEESWARVVDYRRMIELYESCK